MAAPLINGRFTVPPCIFISRPAAPVFADDALPASGIGMEAGLHRTACTFDKA